MASEVRNPVLKLRNVYSSTNVLTSAWVQLDADIDSSIKELEIFDSSGETMKLGIGAAGSEVDLVQIPPGGNEHRVPAYLSEGIRLAIRAVSANATVGEIVINGYN